MIGDVMQATETAEAVSPAQLIGETVRRLRGRRWSQTELGAAMRARGHMWSQSAVSTTELGRRPLLLLEAVDLADLLGVPLTALLDPAEEPLLDEYIAAQQAAQAAQARLDEVRAAWQRQYLQRAERDPWWRPAAGVRLPGPQLRPSPAG
jgi:transcriptional regulator with XRE-family HTH domain